MSKVVQFEVEDKEYVALFRNWYSHELDRTFYICALVTLPERIVTSGATIVHPKDVESKEVGERNSFRRAVLAYLLLKDKAANLQYSLAEIKFLTKLFQKAMGREKYASYGKEEK